MLQAESNIFQNLPAHWWDIISKRVELSSLLSLGHRIQLAREQGPCYPPSGQEWNALRFCAPSDIRVVICGQDPYHGAGQAHGLAFSVGPGCPIPPSLRNIVKELSHDLGKDCPVEFYWDADGFLASWARQGVLLLNDVLTVADGRPGSHRSLGWQSITASILEGLSETSNPMVVILWGKDAALKGEIFQKSHHHVIQSAHPSPLSAHRGFFGSKPFSRTNEWLVRNRLAPIDWCGFHQ